MQTICENIDFWRDMRIIVWSIFLQAVIKMRQIGEQKVWIFGTRDINGRFGDPFR